MGVIANNPIKLLSTETPLAESPKRVFHITIKDETIDIVINDSKNMTVGWLLCEALRKSKIDEEPHSYIFASPDSNPIIDYLLQTYELELFQFPLENKINLIKSNQKDEIIFENEGFLSKLTMVSKIGVGGFSKVFLAKCQQTHKTYALKIIDKLMLLKENKEKFVLNELQIIELLHHKSIVRTLSTKITKSKIIIIQEYCPFGNLFQYIQLKKRLKFEELIFVGLQISSSLDYLHSKNIVYRDLKPDNILICSNGRVKLSDFGLAKILDEKCGKLTSSFCGSPEYISPEMINRQQYSFSVDFYAFGLLLYEMYYGVPPFIGTLNEINKKKLSGSGFNWSTNIPSKLKNLISNLTINDVEKRINSWGVVREELMILKQASGKCDSLHIVISDCLKYQAKAYKIPTMLELEYEVYLDDNMEKYLDEETIKSLLSESTIINN